ncbi:putative fructose-6-phosphate aldolase [Clostridium pasteurianum DSM 525 = ATCC 6013]|uniref:Putative fructose-6-phosphate aldolase n=1 Tax=Clostridium pasteurianum DSM 525 = ATCC 6013 TaxID=1262449 RepID=A0A0H3IZF6_CLOPA|nr:fructose-6-phosphate aldolase [Clostridium pasteurianum]AJA46911.1 putative fructose-6-phosphate aldolase [Clostridium pasteurianum DSM 525 = ATCC 6013]AJA50899.1 putative fructose-6-phosphate aldolase [Clostridium pasteurianum DSM 525 = ATCC 6013]AOZ74296.1 fructose-bisphosphate aldolase [Clostridium pasteurianum DSM 525 = ATCC 6013]AOZ78094.1 fructose-bisphosphate aldolase [Clostridium pasteurianum]ELP58161.1 fructose-6-phosphate aldolase [Clostridium pasteurianum DSM 525 = ATCC 6013]
MEFLLDTANLEEIKKYTEILPLAGVTSNPSIVKKEGKIDFFNHIKEIRNIIGGDASLHVQVVARDYEGMIKDAETILEKIDKDVFIKVPVNEEGLKVIKKLKSQGVNVTATAIYTKFQGFLAITAGADYIAPYFNRMENLNIDPKAVINEFAKEIERSNSKTKILAASFKNVGQVNAAYESGAQAATIGPSIVKEAFLMPSIAKAVKDFTSDWEAIFGKDVKIYNL